MIDIRVRLLSGLTAIEVTGHGREQPDDLDGVRACAAVSVATETCAAYLEALARQDPEHIRFHIEE